MTISAGTIHLSWAGRGFTLTASQSEGPPAQTHFPSSSFQRVNSWEPAHTSTPVSTWRVRPAKPANQPLPFWSIDWSLGVGGYELVSKPHKPKSGLELHNHDKGSTRGRRGGLTAASQARVSLGPHNLRPHFFLSNAAPAVAFGWSPEALALLCGWRSRSKARAAG